MLLIAHCLVSVAIAEGAGDTNVDDGKTAKQILKDAEFQRFNNHELSIDLAQKALLKAAEKKDLAVVANSHALLGRILAKHQNQFKEAEYHFKQSIELFENLNKTEDYVRDSIEYAQVFFAQNKYAQGYKALDKIVELGSKHPKQLWKFKALSDVAKALYSQRKILESEDVYYQILNELPQNNSSSLLLRGNAYHQLGQINKRLKNLDKTARYHKKALETHQKLGDKALIARSMKNLASAEYKRENFLEGLDYAVRGIELQKQLNDPQEKAEFLTVIGMIYRSLNRFETSLEYIIEAHRVYTELNNTAKIAGSLNQMGLLFTKLEKFDDAKSFHNMALEYPIEDISDKTLASSYRELSIIEFNAQNYDLALEMGLKAFQIYATSNEKSKQSVCARIIGKTYEARGEVEQAEIYYQHAVSLAELGESKSDLVKSLNSLGTLRVNDNPTASLNLLERALKLSKDHKFVEVKAPTYRALIRIEESKGNYKKALGYSKKLTSINKKVYQQKEDDRVAIAKAKLDSHMMETELFSLRKQAKYDKLALEKQKDRFEIADQANKIVKLELEKRRYFTILLSALFIVGVFIAIYAYRGFMLSRKHNKELTHLASHDPLTDCLNRRGLNNIFKQDYSELTKEDKYAVIIADIDHFKNVNDTFGHDTGDLVLCSFVDLVKSNIRKTDYLARFGGEEFCILLPNTSLEQAHRIAETIRQQTQKAQFIKYTVTCSFGIAVCDGDLIPPEKIISQADKALYKSKHEGRNKVSVWSTQG